MNSVQIPLSGFPVNFGKCLTSIGVKQDNPQGDHCLDQVGIQSCQQVVENRIDAYYQSARKDDKQDRNAELNFWVEPGEGLAENLNQEFPMDDGFHGFGT